MKASKNSFDDSNIRLTKHLLFSLVNLIFLAICTFSCCKEIPHIYPPPSINALSLVLSGKEYKVNFVNNQAKIILAKDVSISSTAHVKIITYSRGASGVDRKGDDKKIDPDGNLSFSAVTDEARADYKVILSEYPSIKALSLVLSGKEYKIDFVNNQAKIVLTKDVSIPSTAHVKVIIYSRGSRGDTKNGADKKIDPDGSLSFSAVTDEARANYKVILNEYPSIKALSLVLSGKTYDITFDNNHRSEITLPKYSPLPNTTHIKNIIYSKGAKGNTSKGDDKKIESDNLLFIAMKNTTQSKYIIKINTTNLAFFKALEVPKRFFPRTVQDNVVFKNKMWVIGGDNTGEVWSSSDGINWVKETSKAAFSERRGHTVTVFKNKLWLIGGQKRNPNAAVENSAVDFNDVWSSSDGINWVEETSKAAFSGRHSHTVVVFNNKLWLIGGGNLFRDVFPPTSAYNDVWSSSDGKTWTQGTNNPPFIGRRIHSTIVFQNKMWVIGGEDMLGRTLKDVWYSSDGVNWTEVSNTPFSPRSYHYALTFQNKLWIIGGSPNTKRDTYLNDPIWSSTDGLTWIQGASSSKFIPFLSYSWANALSYNNKIWIIGGSLINEGSSNNVWSSSNGQTWKKEGETLLPRFLHTSVIFNNKLWVIGGVNESGRLDDVWSSSSGNNNDWQRIYPNSKIFDRRSSHASTVFKNKIWVIGGVLFNGKFSNDVWSSNNGEMWVEETAQAPFTARTGHRTISFKNKLWVIGGGFPTPSNDIWTSENGKNWNQVNVTGVQFSPRGYFELLVFNDKLWVIGGGDDANKKNDVWSSSDGTSWIKEVDAPFPARSRFGAFVFNNSMWIIGGSSQNNTKLSDIWFSRNGKYWEKLTASSNFSSRSDMSVSVFKDRFWVIGGVGTNSLKYDVWKSN